MKVMIVFGTRPEIIKLVPVIKEFEHYKSEAKVVLVSTGQHREFTRQMTECFDIRPDYDIDVMRPRQTLAHVLSKVVEKLDPILEREAPDVLMVQGDTTSSTAAALAATFRGIQVAHVEAGLRTPEKFLPFPEEVNRRVTGISADWHFAPTARAKANLLGEGKSAASVYVTGNTVVDALHMMFADIRGGDPSHCRNGGRQLLVTLHRRESFGVPVKRVCYALKAIVDDNEDVSIVFPVHWNPSVRGPVREILGDHPRIKLVPPYSYLEFLRALHRCYLVLTDSGGVQEEAPTFGKPVLVLRELTERPEAVEAGVARLVGTDPYRIISAAGELLGDDAAYEGMKCRVSPFGDGRASRRIVGVLMHDGAGLPMPDGVIAEWGGGCVTSLSAP